MGTTDKPATADPADDCRRHREALIDEALMETFPASDPPSIARPAACSDDRESGDGGSDEASDASAG